MIDIDYAIKESKFKNNISDGGSQCFDFDDVVLVKYTVPIKYLNDGIRTREKSEEIMESLREKVKKGVNTPEHLDVRRTVEGDNDVCYVMQRKCPGVNCASISKYGVSFDEVISSLEFILNIPIEHYKKLITDGFELFEMGYEAKNKNLFYDINSGFWYIDFLANDTDYKFDINDIKKVFEALNYRIPKPIQIASSLNYNSTLTDNEKEKKNKLVYKIKAKTLLAIESVVPNFSKYEKFFLAEENDEYKKFLFDNKIVKSDLNSLDDFDYETYNELYEIVINNLISSILNGKKFWDIECNDIRNESRVFNLCTIYKVHKDNKLDENDFDDKYEYNYATNDMYKYKMLFDLCDRLKDMELNENVSLFLEEANKYFESHKINRELLR